MAKILIADDSLAELQIFQQALQSTGHSITTVMDGEAAEEKLKTEKVDLIILDVIMPKKNGFQVCRDIKTNDKLKNIPVIMVTSKDQESDKFWGMKQGADEYLTKPFKPEDLLRAVKKYI
ncbi:MAG TPA: response regulator [Nitrospirota bacterium]|nr:response regulator [Nitrospirota bacterium]